MAGELFDWRRRRGGGCEHSSNVNLHQETSEDAKEGFDR